MKEKILNTSYFIGMLLVEFGVVVQIAKTATTQSASDLSLAWLVMLVIGHLLHLPRSFSSKFWVWKTNCVVCIVLIATLLGMTIVWG